MPQTPRFCCSIDTLLCGPYHPDWAYVFTRRGRIVNVGIVVAAGKSERMGPKVDKAFLNLGTKPVLAYSVMAYERCRDIETIVLVVRKDRVESARAMVQMYGYAKVRKVVAGGPTRQASVGNGLDAVSDEARIVSVHDGARPCVTPELISETIEVARKHGSGVAAQKITDTVKVVERGLKVTKTVDRTKLWAVQTPQTFKFDILVKAYKSVKKKKLTVTDEAQAVESIKGDVRLVPAPLSNVKVATPDDLVLVATLLRL
jgi:2-C-methyl-D-erythritol 4-phosphate cytidylyltransferase